MPCLRFLFPVSLKICHFFPAVYVPFPPSTPFSFGAKMEKDNFQCSHSILSHHWMWISLFMLLPWPYRVSSIFQQQIVFFLDFYDEETNKFVCDCSCPTWFMQLSTRFWRVSCSRTVAIVCQKNEEHKIKAKTIKSYARVFFRILKRGQKKYDIASTRTRCFLSVTGLYKETWTLRKPEISQISEPWRKKNGGEFRFYSSVI